jgi:hypothetical protein
LSQGWRIRAATSQASLLPPTLRVQLTKAEVRNAAEIERAIDRFAREPNCGLIVLPNPTKTIAS